MVEFYVSNRICTLDESTLPQKGIVSDNPYVAHFNFDDEWAGKVKTARFINGKITVHKLLDNDACEFPPEILESGLIKVGVFSGDFASTEARVPINASILDQGGLPADPTPNIYEQLLKAIEEIRNNPVSDEEIKAAVQKYLEENPIETSHVTIRQWTEADVEEGEDS